MSVRYLSCGDTAFTVEFGNEISPAINGKVMALHAAIDAARAAGKLPGAKAEPPKLLGVIPWKAPKGYEDQFVDVTEQPTTVAVADPPEDTSPES